VRERIGSAGHEAFARSLAGWLILKSLGLAHNFGGGEDCDEVLAP